jgi:hypothetical protein
MVGLVILSFAAAMNHSGRHALNLPRHLTGGIVFARSERLESERQNRLRSLFASCSKWVTRSCIWCEHHKKRGVIMNSHLVPQMFLMNVIMVRTS